MKEVIERNHKKAYEKYQAELRKKQKKEKIITIFVATFIVLMTMLVISFSNKEMKKAIDNCVNKGYTENYCIERL